MTVDIYNTTDDKRKLNKTLTAITTVQAFLKSDVDIINPVIDVDLFSDYANANYIYIADFKRYYFVNGIEILAGGIIRLKCTVDVLMSFKSEINNITIMVDRNTGGSPFVDDGVYRLQMPYTTFLRKLTGSEILNPVGAGNTSFVLQTLGGVRD